MGVVKELLRTEANGSLSFGNYELPAKEKVSDYQNQGDLYKVKTYKDITKLEKNDMFLYESVPGTAVTGFVQNDAGMEFQVEGAGDVQITLGLADDTEYKVELDGANVDDITTTLGGKLSFSVELTEGTPIQVTVKTV